MAALKKLASAASATFSRRNLLVGAATVAAEEAARRLLFDSPAALAQGAAHAAPAQPIPQPPKLSAEAEAELQRRMLTFGKELYSVPREQLSEEIVLRRVAMSRAIKKISQDLDLRPILVNVDTDYLDRLARYGNGKEPTNAKIKIIGSADESHLYQLLMGSGAIPADSNVTFTKDFKPQRPIPTGALPRDGKRAEGPAPDGNRKQ